MPPRADFWKLIDATRPRRGLLGMFRARDPDELHEMHAGRLATALARRSAEEIIAFQKSLDEQLDRAYRWELWDAAFLMMGGCGDDGFEYFRAWLISKGRATFERVLEDPDRLADLDVEEPDFECDFESLLSVAAEAYGMRTGGDLYDALSGRETKAEPTSEHVEEDRLAARFPRIAAKRGY